MLTLIKTHGPQSGTFTAQEVIKPNPSHLLENLVLFQLEHGGFSSLKSHELKADILLLAVLLGAMMMDKDSAGLLRVTKKSRTGDLQLKLERWLR